MLHWDVFEAEDVKKYIGGWTRTALLIPGKVGLVFPRVVAKEIFIAVVPEIQEKLFKEPVVVWHFGLLRRRRSFRSITRSVAVSPRPFLHNAQFRHA